MRQLDLFERSLGEELYNTRKWLGRVGRKLERLEETYTLIQMVKKHVPLDEQEKSHKIEQMDMFG